MFVVRALLYSERVPVVEFHKPSLVWFTCAGETNLHQYLRDALTERIMMIDGAMGTMIQVEIFFVVSDILPWLP
jgi:hypothetical protein